MNCTEFEASVHPYVDGELPVEATAAANAHASECRDCERLAQRERQFRELLRRQPQEMVPPEFRAKITRLVHRKQRHVTWRLWLAAPTAAAVAAILVALVLPALRPSAPLLDQLVDKHITYAQIERPVELASGDRGEVEDWFRQRAGLRVTVPDYSPAGLHLIGARLADAHARRAAYLFYEKGRTLLSVFIVPIADGDSRVTGRRTGYRGHDYVMNDIKGFRTVSWTEGHALFGLVSALDYDALLECANRLRVERAERSRL
jgi:anti-sigma factor RsiW